MHQSVLLDEAIDALSVQPDGTYIDGTFGRGGHTRALLKRLNEQGTLLAVDKDPQAITVANTMADEDQRITVIQDSFAHIGERARQYNCFGKVNGILLDLGVSSPQLDESERGFSFLRDGPLDMRMDPTSGIPASDWLMAVRESDLADVLKQYGEERFAKRIARAIVAAREKQSITRTLQLAEIVAKANPKWEKHKHPATRVFQAIRIFINSELTDLEVGLTQCLDVLAVGGRLVVISFHSLEDRMVKRFIRHHSRGTLPVGLPVSKHDSDARLRVIGKAVKASDKELASNPRARSAVLRVGEKIA